ncbi:hypothetical protein [Sneathiella limimaris]|uniref:glucosamine inositolphosphorylceramide transferase family protein n=1 Tax=Sneathiella limimaris TaxID=1964213 RepID=UPI00146DFD3C|nr:hypothetical protein [Sneathiella limimaris]
MAPLFKFIWRLFHREIWSLGIYRKGIDQFLSDPISEPQWIETNSTFSFLADPVLAPIRQDGSEKTILIAERMNFLKGRGTLAYAELPQNVNSPLKWKVIKNEAFHLSYPCYLKIPTREPEIWAEGHETFSIPTFEFSNNASSLTRKSSINLGGIPFVDPTPFWHKGLLWLFATRQDDNPNQNLYLYYAAPPFNEWQAHPQNPVKENLSSARPAGSLFHMKDGELIRPAQDCSRTYGGAVTLNRITELSTRHFQEEYFITLAPQSDWSYSDGLHTISTYQNMTIIDAKKWRFSLIEPIRQLAVGLYNRKRRQKLTRQFQS